VALGFAGLIPPLIADAMGGQYPLALTSTAVAYLSHHEIADRGKLDHIKTVLEQRSVQTEPSQPKGECHAV
jgi:hypothetical protein